MNAVYLSEYSRTGRYRYRLDWLLRVVLQTEVILTPCKDISPVMEEIEVSYWRDATEYDIKAWLGDSKTFAGPPVEFTDPYAPLTGRRGFKQALLGSRMLLKIEYGVAKSVDGSGLFRVVDTEWRTGRGKDVQLGRVFKFVKTNDRPGSSREVYEPEKEE